MPRAICRRRAATRGAESSIGIIQRSRPVAPITSSPTLSSSVIASVARAGGSLTTSPARRSTTISSSPPSVCLIDVTSLRIGNDQYARANKSFGVTTLHNRHVAVRGSTIRIAFRGKSAQRFDVGVHNARLANIVRRCQHLPGQHLFKYRSADGSVRRVTSSDVNTYLAEHAAPGVTAKTFRTWNATVLAAERLAAASEHVETATIKVLNEVVDSVADHLGNTRAVCRNSYVHPAVVDSHLDATLLRQWARPTGKSPSGLTVAEHKTLRLLTRSRTRLPA